MQTQQPARRAPEAIGTSPATWAKRLLWQTITALSLFCLAGASLAAPAPGTPTVPGAPIMGTPTAGNTEATAIFKAPRSNGGSPITGYTVTSIPAGGVDTNAGSTSLSHLITGLVNGTAYTFSATATNAIGTGPASAPSRKSATPGPVAPDAPLNPAAVGGNAQATVIFQIPASDGGSPITGYTVTSLPKGGTDSNAGTTGLSHIITGLTNGTAYTFTVTATNAAGTSVASTPTNSVTPAVTTAPGAPTSVTATGGNAQATVTFIAPASNGGSAITGYTVTSIPAGGVDSNAGTTGLSHLVTGLANGTAYTFTVTATNAVGTSVPSASSNSVTPMPPPSVTTLTSSLNPAPVGQAVLLTVSVTGTTPTGTVTIKDGATILGTVPLIQEAPTLGQAALNITFTTIGTHSLTATYSGDANNAASTSVALTQTININTVTTLLNVTPNPARVAQAVTMTATFSGGLPTGTVTFYDGGTTLGTTTIAAGQATFNTPFTTIGTHSLTAIYNGDANNAPSLPSLAVSLSVIANNVTTYFHNDVSGTPMAETDASGNLVWQQSYRPYGDPVQPPNTDNKLLFTGKPYDTSSGLTYLGARYYDPMLGRFMSTDPKGFDQGNIHSFNRYAYGNNNPNRFVDPDGHSPVDIGFLVWDLAKLGIAVYSGAGAAEAGVDVGLDLIGVISPVPGAGEALKAAKAVEHGVEAVRTAEEASQGAKEAKTLYHYTDEAGAKGIEAEGMIRADERGRVYVTDQKLSPAEVKDRLFIGTSGDKGSHVVEIKPVDGLPIRQGKNENELFHQGSIRDGRQGELTVKQNDF